MSHKSAADKQLQIDDQTLELIHKNWQILEDKYSWSKSNDSFMKFWYKLYYLIMGTLVVIFITIPFILTLLAIILVVFVSYKNNNHKHKRFIDYFRKFICEQRLNLSLYSLPQRKNNIFWHIRNRLIGTFQIVEGLSSTDRLFLQTEEYRALYNDSTAFPFMFGICVTDYDEVVSNIHDPNNKRDAIFAGFEVGADSDCIGYLQAQLLDTTDPRHQIAKDIAIILADTSNITHLNSRLPANYCDEYWKNKDYKTLYYASYYYFIFNGAVLTTSELKMCEKLTKWRGFSILPQWFQFLIAYNYGNRRVYDAIQFIKGLIIKYGGYKYDKIISYCNKHNISPDIGLNSAAFTLLIPGGNPAFGKVARRYNENPQLERKLFRQNPMIYVLEIVRHNTNLPITSVRTQKPMTYTINGKEYTFPVGTILCLSMGYVNNRNDEVFKPEFDEDGKQVLSVNHKEDDYKKCVIFHSKENGYYGNDEDLGPRYCPGRSMGIIYLTAVIRRLHGMEMNDEQEPKCPFQ